MTYLLLQVAKETIADITAERDALSKDLDIQIQRTEDARAERDAGAKMLARQCDMAREAETRVSEITRERDALQRNHDEAQESALENMGRFLRMAKECERISQERDALMAQVEELREQIQGADHADRKLDDLLGSLAGVEGQVVSVQTAKLLHQENQELKATIAELREGLDGIKARSLAVIKARDHDLLTMRDAYSTAMATIAELREELAQWQSAAGASH